MKRLTVICLAALAQLVVSVSAHAAVLYVDVNSTNATPPYISWATAATNIQDAVDAAVTGDQILVTNGVYQTGSRSVGYDSARVVVDKAIAVQSINGPQSTVIDGGGSGRCTVLTNGVTLAGFTLTNGFTFTAEVGGGGVAFSGYPSDAVVSNCVITRCLAHYGGAAGSASSAKVYPPVGGTLVNCTISSNVATGNPYFYFPLDAGGGVDSCRLINCTLIGNIASGPSQSAGGGAYASILQNCLLIGNGTGGGSTGGGAANSALINCTVVGNSASSGAGTYACWLTNCIVVANSTNNHDADNFVAYTCTTPFAAGPGNITNAPLFIDLSAGNLHLQPSSPCIDAGMNLSGLLTNDFDGRPRPLDGNDDGVAAFDMGAYEHLVLFSRQNNPSPSPPYNSWLTAATNIQDAADLTLASAGDQIFVTNGVYQFGGNASGRVLLNNALTTMRSVNGPQATIIDGGGAVRCVLMTNGTFLSGFTLTNGHALDSGGGVGFLGFQSDAVVSNCVIVGNSSPSAGGAGSVLMTGGSQPVGGSLFNCVLSNNSATAFQPGNPTVGIGGAADNCNLNSCALVSNFAAYGGGGASASRLVNCRVTGNSANAEGGGTRWSSLYSCVVTSNSSGTGAAFSSTLVNCTLTANPAGGAYYGSLTNCIVYDNGGVGNQIGATLNYCCTTPLPGSGTGNFTNAPGFVDQISGNFRLQSNSPCINAGDNASAPGSLDLDGRPRIVGGIVDVGAYEFQPGVSGEFIGWLSQFGLPTDGSADYADSDNDLMNNWQEWIAGTVPTDATSALRLLNPSPGPSGTLVTWQSVPNRTYFLERSTNLAIAPVFSVVSSNILGQAGTTSFTDTNAPGTGPFFYRVGVQQ